MALSEVYWGKAENKNLRSFKNRMVANFYYLIAQDINVKSKTGRIEIKKYDFKTCRNYSRKPITDLWRFNQIYNDDAEPAISSPIYKNPVKIKPGQLLKAKLFLNDKLFSETVTGYFYKFDTIAHYLDCELYNKNDITIPLVEADKPYKTIRVSDISPGICIQGTKPSVIKFIGKFKMDIGKESKFYIKADVSFCLLFDNNIVAEKYVQAGVRTLTVIKYKPIKPDIGIVLEYAIDQGGEILEIGNINESGGQIPLNPEKYYDEFEIIQSGLDHYFFWYKLYVGIRAINDLTVRREFLYNF